MRRKNHGWGYLKHRRGFGRRYWVGAKGQHYWRLPLPGEPIVSGQTTELRVIGLGW
jgi:hypothetical protein